MTPLFLFVYGTLRRVSATELHSLLQHRAKSEGEGTVQAQLFDLGEYPGLITSQSASDRVLGEVYWLDPSLAADTLRRLDEYEGLTDDHSAHEYRREILKVVLSDGSKIDAWAYVLNDNPPPFRRIPSGDYFHRAV